ncbi:MAG: lipid kinase YegS [Actinomycetota bacterium]
MSGQLPSPQHPGSPPAAPEVSTFRRACAIVALLAAAILLVAIVLYLIANIGYLILGLIALALAGGGGWLLVTEQMPRRAVGAVLLGAGVLVMLWTIFQVASDSEHPVLRMLVVIVLAAVAVIGTRLALVHELHASDLLDEDMPRPAHPVLICNPWSGGGKVAKFRLKERAEALGVEVVMLDKGLDLEELARDAIARGADCIGMAGGDGSQALVAAIAIEAGIPFVCISAGTRNHFAQDLGFDKEDPAAGLVAFVDGVPRQIDYGRVNGRLFVNNVSLGIYARVVQEDSYRGAKVETAKTLLPDLLGSQAEPFDLQFTTPDGTNVDGAFLIMVSNNPYVSGLSLDAFQRRTMDSGKLGVLAVNTSTGTEAAALVTRASLGLAGRDPNLHEFDCERFEVRSHSGEAYAGIDGEALTLDTPLDFQVFAGGLHMLVPPDVLVAAEHRRHRSFVARDLVDVAAGRQPKRLRAAAELKASRSQ